MGGGQDGGHEAAFGQADERGYRRPDVIEHRESVVCPLFERGRLSGEDGVGEAHAAAVVPDEATERGQAVEKPGAGGQLGHLLGGNEPVGDQKHVAS